MSVSPTTLTGSPTSCATQGGTPPLPVGMSANGTTCVLSGTPTFTSGATTYDMIATNSAGSSPVAPVTLEVTANAATCSGLPGLNRALCTYPLLPSVVDTGVITDTTSTNFTFFHDGGTNCMQYNNSAALTALAPNQPCVQYYSARTDTGLPNQSGLQTQAGFNNLLLWSEDLTNGAWAEDPAVVVASGTAADPLGNADVGTVTLYQDAGSRVYQSATVLNNGGYVLSGWVWVDAGTPPQQFALSATQAVANWTSAKVSNVFVATSTPTRFALPFTAVGTTAVVGMGGKGPSANFFPDVGPFYTWGWQLERVNVLGSAGFPTPYVKTTSAAGPAQWTEVQMKNSFANGGPFCLFVDAALSGVTGMVWVIGGPYLQNNNAALWTGSGSLTFIVKDNAGGTKQVQKTTAIPADFLLHNIGACSDASGVMDIWIDGTRQNLTATGTGTGIITTMPAKIYFGSDGTASFPMQGMFRDFCQDTDAGVCARAAITDASPSLNVLAIGDSTTSSANAGATNALPYPQVLGSLLGATYSVTNGGVSGYTTAQMKTNYENNYRPGKGSYPSGGFHRCILMGGINDLIILGGVTEATALANLEGTLAEMVADGCKPIIMSPIPCGQNTGQCTGSAYTNYVQLRSDIQAYCANSANGCTYLDTWNMLGNGANPVALQAYYAWTDNKHETQLACDVIAETLAPLIP